MKNKTISSIDGIHELLVTYELNPKKRYGQNFLISDKIPNIIMSQSELKDCDVIIEIGPGLGSLTEHLLKLHKPLYCVEIDNQLCGILKKTFSGNDNLHIVNKDFLKTDIESLKIRENSKVCVVSNLPYYITKEILVKLLLEERNFTIIAMMQKEVAYKILQKNEINELVYASTNFCDVSKVTDVSKNEFFPKPNVDSCVLKFSKKNIVDKQIYLNLFNIITSQKRKTIYNNIKEAIPDGLNLYEPFVNILESKSGVSLLKRADELSLEKLHNFIEKFKNLTVFQSNAKINIGLSVGKIQNNMHKVSSLFCPISLFDEMLILPINDKKLLIDCNANINNNVIKKVFNYYLSKDILNCGFYVKLFKRIPVGSGLGGGSSNSAVFLKYIENYTTGYFEKEKMLTELGQDCTYFYNYNKISLLDGIYEFNPVESDLMNKYVLIITPNIEILTTDMYKSVKIGDFYVKNTQYNEIKGKQFNSFEELMKDVAEWNNIMKIIENANPYSYGMSGSGPTIYVIDDLINLMNLKEKMPCNLRLCKLCKII